ncbi:MAG: FdrA family protein [Jatrophihabitantaceae bacterium]
MAERIALRRGQYADSVALMLLSRTVAELPGVQAALVAMATELNLRLLAGMGFDQPAVESANDLIIAIRAADEAALGGAFEQAERLLDAPAGAGSAPAGELPPRTVGAAANRFGPGLAVISVPGRHAFTEAMDALEAGCDVLLFSDNVPLEQEIALKDAAAERGLLVMGPDCGTAVVGGIGLGFAHTLAAGPVGVLAASGTGAQQVLCLLDAAGVGITAALGVGGRDLSEQVAGRSTRTGLAMLEADPDTELILLVSKPPAEQVAAALRAEAERLTTPVRFALLGPGQPDLTAAVEQALRALGVAVPRWPAWPRPAEPRPGCLRGLFCGGTLCDEAMLLASAVLGEIRSNIPLRPAWALPDPLAMAAGHWMVDFGEDALTQGRAHPMIDPTLRDQQLSRVLTEPDTAVVLADVVLGHGAHPDPAAGLLPIIEAAEVPVVISLIGARRDPQDVYATAQRLHRAGASVFFSNAAATRHAVSLLEGKHE